MKKKGKKNRQLKHPNAFPAKANTCETLGVLVSPEDKMLATKGMMPGRRTLAQYLKLVSLGYAKDVVDRWTAYRADQELKNIESNGVPRKQAANAMELKWKAANQQADKQYRESLPKCPVCYSRVRPDRLGDHMQRVHPTYRSK